MHRSTFYALIGLGLGTCAPIGGFLLRALLSPFSFHVFCLQEWQEHDFFYEYMLIGTCTVFSLFGFAVGWDEDQVLRRNIRLSNEVLTDPLTGLGNHRFLHDVFKIEFRRHITSREPISCFMMDLDHFKKINDTFGHPFGDVVLKQFAVLVKKCIREGDVAARYGGEEFLCILPNCDEQAARVVAERIRRETEKYEFSSGNDQVRMTISVGVITSYESTGLNYRHLINLSDQALYEAKRKGRNQVIQAVINMEKELPETKGDGNSPTRSSSAKA